MPQFINIFELARRGETIEGEVAVKDLPNLLGFTATENGTLRFVATGLGERRGLPAVDLDMEGDVDISCARCLKPMSVHIASGAVFRLVRTEAEANALPIEDDEEDEDVLVGSRNFDLEKWVEEEAILALPRMVVHDACEEKREWSDGEEPQEEKRVLVRGSWSQCAFISSQLHQEVWRRILNRRAIRVRPRVCRRPCSA